MDNVELRAAREKLGLTPAEAADVLDTSPKTINRIESDPSNKMHREAPARVERLYKAYLAGYRPDDWPEHLVGREERMKLIDEVRV